MNTWITIGDLHFGIEEFLLNGPQPMRELCIYANVHGVRDGLTIHNIHALREASRLEFDSETHMFSLSAWNRESLQRLQRANAEESQPTKDRPEEPQNINSEKH